MRARRRFFSVFLAVLLPAILLLASPYIVLADEIPPETGGEDAAAGQGDIIAGTGGITLMNTNPPDYIDSEEAFRDWIDSHSDNGNVIGGSVTLLANITIKKHILLSGPLSIDTGAYGLTMDGGSVNGPFSITGEGVDVPVLTIVNMKYNPWDCILPAYNVTARGRDGAGGVAVHIRSSINGSPGFLESQGHIRSEGEGAVGVLFDYPVKAHFLSVSVEGKNSVAVSAPDGASLYYGRLEASGDGSKIVSGGNIMLDTCKISGDASGADIINREIVALAGSWLYWPLAQGHDISESSLYHTFSKLHQVSFLLSGNEAHPAEVIRIYSQWDLDKIDTVDTSAIGKTVIPGMLYDSYQGLGLEDKFSLDLTVDVRDGSKPCVISLSFGDAPDIGRRYVYFEIYDDWSGFGFEPKDGNFILWRSDDEGESWYDFTSSPDVSLASGGITYHYDEITGPVWFRVQEIDGEYSNIAIIYGYEGKTYGATGGDRTGVDRGGEDPVISPAPPAKPAPEHKSSSSSTSKSALPDETSEIAVQTSAELISPPLDDTLSSTDEIPESSETGDNITLPDEWENDTATAVSGKRLRMMMNAGSRVTFIKNEVRLSFDALALEKLDIGDSQLFTVEVARLEQFKYTVTATLDGMELYSLPCVATLDGNSYDILVSGICDFIPPIDNPDVIPEQTHSPELAVTQQPRETAGEEKANNLTDMEERPSASPTVVFVMFGTGCVIATAVFVKFRVKKYGR